MQETSWHKIFSLFVSGPNNFEYVGMGDKGKERVLDDVESFTWDSDAPTRLPLSLTSSPMALRLLCWKSSHGEVQGNQHGEGPRGWSQSAWPIYKWGHVLSMSGLESWGHQQQIKSHLLLVGWLPTGSACGSYYKFDSCIATKLIYYKPSILQYILFVLMNLHMYVCVHVDMMNSCAFGLLDLCAFDCSGILDLLWTYVCMMETCEPMYGWWIAYVYAHVVIYRLLYACALLYIDGRKWSEDKW